MINSLLGSDGPFIRRSAKTRSWEKAEDFKRKLEEEYEAKEKGLEEASRPEPTLVTVKEAVARFLNSKRNENLADSTLDKLTAIFEKQFLAWATSCGFTPGRSSSTPLSRPLPKARPLPSDRSKRCRTLRSPSKPTYRRNGKE
jgi:hypothetical protein